MNRLREEGKKKEIYEKFSEYEASEIDEDNKLSSKKVFGFTARNDIFCTIFYII
jgi:hypothetical protein